MKNCKGFVGPLMIGIIFIVAMGAVGYGAAKLVKKEDGMVEEAAEAAIEDVAEDLIGLPDGALEGKVDLTPSSKEDK